MKNIGFMNLQELLTSLVDLKKEQLSLRFRKSTNSVVDFTAFRKIRRDIARINTRLSSLRNCVKS